MQKPYMSSFYLLRYYIYYDNIMKQWDLSRLLHRSTGEGYVKGGGKHER